MKFLCQKCNKYQIPLKYKNRFFCKPKAICPNCKSEIKLSKKRCFNCIDTFLHIILITIELNIIFYGNDYIKLNLSDSYFNSIIFKLICIILISLLFGTLYDIILSYIIFGYNKDQTRTQG